MSYLEKSHKLPKYLMMVGSHPVIFAYSSSLISLDFLTSMDNNLLTLMDLLIHTDVISESVPLGHLI